MHKELRPKAPHGHPTSMRLLHSHLKSPMQGRVIASASSPDKGRQADSALIGFKGFDSLLPPPTAQPGLKF